MCCNNAPRGHGVLRYPAMPTDTFNGQLTSHRRKHDHSTALCCYSPVKGRSKSTWRTVCTSMFHRSKPKWIAALRFCSNNISLILRRFCFAMTAISRQRNMPNSDSSASATVWPKRWSKWACRLKQRWATASVKSLQRQSLTCSRWNKRCASCSHAAASCSNNRPVQWRRCAPSSVIFNIYYPTPSHSPPKMPHNRSRSRGPVMMCAKRASV